MDESEPIFVVATLWEYIEPIDRGDRYEDPLDEALEPDDLGEVCGGGSQLSDECGIEFVNIEIEFYDLEHGLPLAKATLESSGAPKGSSFRFTEGDEDKIVEFGVTECLAVFLDGLGLPVDVYKNTNIRELADLLYQILEAQSLGEIRSSWNGPKETAIFLYGADAEAMFLGLRPVLETYPLCQNARIVIRHGNPQLQPRTVRLPMLSQN